MTSVHLQRSPMGLPTVQKPFISRLELMQERLQARQEVEKRQRLLELAERAEMNRMSMSSLALSESFRAGPGRVRQMFEERRRTGNFSSPPSSKSSPIGWDKSYPLDPLGGSADSYKQRGASLERSGYYGNMNRSQSQSGIHKIGSNRSTKPFRQVNGQKSHSNVSDDMEISSWDSARTTSPPLSGPGRANPKKISQNTFRKPTRSTKEYMTPKSRSQSQPPPQGRLRPPSDQSDSGSDSRSSSSSHKENLGSHQLELEMKRREHHLMNKIKAQEREIQQLNSANKPKAKPTRQAPKRLIRNKVTSSELTDADNGRPVMQPKPAHKPSAKLTSKSEPPREVRKHEPPKPGMSECPICYRHFNEDRIEKHKTICEKSATKKRKIFDVTKMRTGGTEAEKFVKKGSHLKEPPKPKKKDWRKQREEFITAIREARKVQKHLDAGGSLADLPPPPPSDTSDYIQCPHCGRKFNEGAAERHIPKCKNILSNKKR